MKKLLFIHGGEVFSSKEELKDFLKEKNIELENYLEEYHSWKEDFKEFLKGRNIAPIFLKMPCKDCADYSLWELWFEKHLNFFEPEDIFAGHSLGASFLIKYFSTKDLGKFSQLHLISPAVSDIETFSCKFNDYSLLEKQFKEIFIYHSADDDIVSFKESKYLSDKIKKAKFIKFQDKGHFILDNSPELEKFIK